jgi:hypothetical protein
MRHIVICACPDLQYFSTLSHTLNSFRKNKWTWNVFWLSLQFLSAKFLILRRNKRDMIKKYMLVFM